MLTFRNERKGDLRSAVQCGKPALIVKNQQLGKYTSMDSEPAFNAKPMFTGVSNPFAILEVKGQLRKTGLDPTSGNLTDAHFSKVNSQEASSGCLLLKAAYERLNGDLAALSSDPVLTPFGVNLDLMLAKPPVNAEDFAKLTFYETYTIGGNPDGGYEGMRG